MQLIKNISIPGSENYPIGIDICFINSTTKKPVVIYAHGFNGFKDWGNFDLIANRFASLGFVFIKFNFSHNGTSIQEPEAFTQLELFGNNNYTKELYDLNAVINWAVEQDNPYANQINPAKLSLIGHSLGGGMAILQTSVDARIRQLVTWAAVAACKTPWTNWTQNQLNDWQQTGVAYYTNTRTNQQMPLYYQLYQDFIQNSTILNIEQAIQNINIPLLICHGLNDKAVPVNSAYHLAQLQPAASLFIIDSDHVFGRKHPWTADNLPQAMDAVVKRTIHFLQNA
ncbi:alpha/beta hydrolase family protein [Limnovirga soli]|uniref:Prolyl oligopeptidase family serine peptidase n=1 Tax=Limnovirga soli TaxID=2656915 RepID=A0A8J8JU25_9BACT|nr:dienelactone hydrolase family protein [Limnovirga soli]NNV55099.1 prolyl oligopeptidase family serine peptidase [Limnovirga soli]